MTYPMAGDPAVCDRELQLALDRYWDTPDDDDDENEEEKEEEE